MEGHSDATPTLEPQETVSSEEHVAIEENVEEAVDTSAMREYADEGKVDGADVIDSCSSDPGTPYSPYDESTVASHPDSGDISEDDHNNAASPSSSGDQTPLKQKKEFVQLQGIADDGTSM